MIHIATHLGGSEEFVLVVFVTKKKKKTLSTVYLTITRPLWSPIQVKQKETREGVKCHVLRNGELYLQITWIFRLSMCSFPPVSIFGLGGPFPICQSVTVTQVWIQILSRSDSDTGSHSLYCQTTTVRFGLVCSWHKRKNTDRYLPFWPLGPQYCRCSSKVWFDQSHRFVLLESRVHLP